MWLPVQQRIYYKVALLTFKLRSTSTPSTSVAQSRTDNTHGHNLRSATTTLCQPFTTTTFAKRAYTDALLQLFGTHYRKLSLIVTLLLSLSLGYRHSSSPGLFLSPFLSSTLPDLTALYKYVHCYMGILIAHRTGNFEGGNAGPL